MKCQFCNFDDTQVKDTRASEDGSMIKRRRFCLNCGGRFTTIETISKRTIKVIKRNGDIRIFEQDKIMKSMEIATRKRNVTNDQLDSALHSIVRKIEQYGEGEIQSHQIGQLVMNELAVIDQVAYVRYASVYKSFKEVGDFGKFIACIKHG